MQDRKQEPEILPCGSPVETPSTEQQIAETTQEPRIPYGQQLHEFKLRDNETTRTKHQFSKKLRHDCKI